MIKLNQVRLVEQVSRDFNLLLTRAMDATAKSRGYDGIVSLCSYVNSGNPTYAAEAGAGIAYRDAACAYLVDTISRISAGTLPAPSKAEFTAGIPGIVWPE